VIELKPSYLLIGALSVLVVLLSRVIVVCLPAWLLPRFTNINRSEAGIVVWGGLRGGLSIALVLSLPESEAKELLTIATYTCVVVSILLQGLTIERFAKKMMRDTNP
jgi:CPA1 family monovalent cation:H+ antiporter